MLYHLGSFLQQFWGPTRLLQSYTVLISLALYTGFFATYALLPKFYSRLPQDRGREFTIKENAEAARGKPTGAGFVFITIYALLCVIFVPMGILQAGILVLTWLTMLFGYLDDRSITSWGEYLKGFLDLVIAVLTALLILFCISRENSDGNVHFWFPFVSQPVNVHPVLFIAISVVLIWASINTTNCTDGVDGLSGSLVLIALLTLGSIFYFILGHTDIANYLLVPHLANGAKWALMTFSLAGVLMGYLWHNAFPSSVLMGDAGSRALGYFIGVMVLISGNPLLIFATSTVIFLNGGMGLLKVFLLRFLHIKIFEKIRFPLHDHMRKNKGWSATQVLLKFMILQLLITVAVLGLFFKVR